MIAESDMNYDPVSGEPRFSELDAHDSTYQIGGKQPT